MSETEITEWNGCYRDGWKSLIGEASFSHPAKFSRGLIRRIYEHAMDESWLIAGDVVCDPFGGIALGAFDAAMNGAHWIGCELESKFVTLGNENIELWKHRYGHRPGYGSARLIQGDSRKLSEVLREAQICVSSPPFSGDGKMQPHNGGPGSGRGQGVRSAWAVRGDSPENHGQTSPGNLGNLRATKAGLQAVISSPPYLDARQEWQTNSEDSENIRSGKSDGQLSAMKEGDFSSVVSSKRRGVNGDYADQSPGQLGAMPDKGFDLVCSSPPFEAGTDGGIRSAKFRDPVAFAREMSERDSKRRPVSVKARLAQMERQNEQVYGDTEGNIGNQQGRDFWSAAKQIVEEAYKVLAPGAHAIWVVKGFVRKKAYVDFPDQWRQLCEAVGFVTLHWHNASLVEHSGTQHTLDGGEDKIEVQRKSFFRRLAESKGSPAINSEVVLCMIKPTGAL